MNEALAALQEGGSEMNDALRERIKMLEELLEFKRTEIYELRSNLRIADTTICALRAQIPEQVSLSFVDEIERLRMITAPGSCECSPEDACRYARERDEARADIERLRHEMAEMAVANVAATKTAIGSYQDEIERLRSLLREALRIDDGDFSVSVDDWIKRVREALEEQC